MYRRALYRTGTCTYIKYCFKTTGTTQDYEESSYWQYWITRHTPVPGTNLVRYAHIKATKSMRQKRRQNLKWQYCNKYEHPKNSEKCDRYCSRRACQKVFYVVRSADSRCALSKPS